MQVSFGLLELKIEAKYMPEEKGGTACSKKRVYWYSLSSIGQNFRGGPRG